MYNEYQTSKKQQPGWYRYRAFAIIAIGVGAFVAYLVNDPIAPVETEYESIKREPCGMKRLIDSRGVPYYITPTDTTSGKHEWFYVEPSPNNHLPEDSGRLLSANWDGGHQSWK